MLFRSGLWATHRQRVRDEVKRKQHGDGDETGDRGRTKLTGCNRRTPGRDDEADNADDKEDAGKREIDARDHDFGSILDELHVSSDIHSSATWL